jgi:L-lactate dehydrogenase complex protein LldG
VNTSKENILKKIRKALSNPVPLPFSQSEGAAALFPPATDELEVLFATNFSKLQGRFVYCENETQLVAQIQQLIAAREWTKIYCSNEKWNPVFSNTINLATCDASVTGCELLVARTGSIVLSAAEIEGRTASVYAPVHICIAYTHQLVFDVKDALVGMKERYGQQLPSMISFATGPSRTADIEKTLVTGVHGPKEVYLFLLEA